MQVAEVILPLPLDKLFHYAIPAEMVGSVRPGVRILVQFGARKEYAAIVTRVLEAPDETELKYLISVLDEHPVVLEHQLLQWSWMASYYMAPSVKMHYVRELIHWSVTVSYGSTLKTIRTS